MKGIWEREIVDGAWYCQTERVRAIKHANVVWGRKSRGVGFTLREMEGTDQAKGDRQAMNNTTSKIHVQKK